MSRATLASLLPTPWGQIGRVSAPPGSSPNPNARPPLGRWMAAILAALVVMVILGVLGIWRHARNEQAWRDRVMSADTFVTPTNR